jgi:hypothetical protein
MIKRPTLSSGSSLTDVEDGWGEDGITEVDGISGVEPEGAREAES